MPMNKKVADDGSAGGHDISPRGSAGWQSGASSPAGHKNSIRGSAGWDSFSSSSAGHQNSSGWHSGSSLSNDHQNSSGWHSETSSSSAGWYSGSSSCAGHQHSAAEAGWRSGRDYHSTTSWNMSWRDYDRAQVNAGTFKGSAAARRQRANNSADGQAKRQKYNTDRKLRKDQKNVEGLASVKEEPEDDDGVHAEPVDGQGVPSNPVGDDEGVPATDNVETLIVPDRGNRVAVVDDYNMLIRFDTSQFKFA